MYFEQSCNLTRSFDSVDVIISEHATASPWLTFVRRQEPAGRIVYEMRSNLKGQVVTGLRGKSGNSVGYEWDGSMGEIALRDLGSKVKVTIIRDFPHQEDGGWPRIQLDGVAIESLIECQNRRTSQLLRSLVGLISA